MRISEKKSLLVFVFIAMALVFALTQLWPSAALADDDDGDRRGKSSESRSNSDHDDDDEDDDRKKPKKPSVESILMEMQAQAAADKAELLARIGELENELSTLIVQQPNTLSQELAAHDANLAGLVGGQTASLTNEIAVHDTNIGGAISAVEASLGAALAALSEDLALHDTVVAGDLPPGGGALGAALASLASQLADHDASIHGSVAATSTSLTTDLTAVQQLVYDTHTVDPFDMTVTVCASTGGFATFDQDASFATDFNYGPFIGADIYGTGATVDYRAQFANTLNSSAGASTGVTMNACMDGIIVRQDGSIDTNPTTDLNENEILFLTQNLGSEAELDELRASLIRSAMFDNALYASTLSDSITEVSEVDLNLLNTFRIVNGDLGSLEDSLPLPSKVKRDFPNSPIPASIISIDALSICSLEGIETFTTVDGNPIASICDTAGEGQLLADAIASISETLNPAIDRIETKVDTIENTTNSIFASVGNGLRDIVVRIRTIANNICGFLGC